jgi:hypothetical protein
MVEEAGVVFSKIYRSAIATYSPTHCHPLQAVIALAK